MIIISSSYSRRVMFFPISLSPPMGITLSGGFFLLFFDFDIYFLSCLSLFYDKVNKPSRNGDDLDDGLAFGKFLYLIAFKGCFFKFLFSDVL